MSPHRVLLLENGHGDIRRTHTALEPLTLALVLGQKNLSHLSTSMHVTTAARHGEQTAPLALASGARHALKHLVPAPIGYHEIKVTIKSSFRSGLHAESPPRVPHGTLRNAPLNGHARHTKSRTGRSPPTRAENFHTTERAHKLKNHTVEKETKTVFFRLNSRAFAHRKACLRKSEG